ncbi:hypothetical protein HB991_14035 [Yersinia mollaretii]|uniref:Uncharacterized protein n=1 Tax=Yersinia mollaretii TaxID=33060 RepID=A0AA44I0N3_YERMO|nr:hypothetical protein [Yersinia mollaretii]NIL23625.1 hypothetical protein [Yersinia mollaretii]CNJ09890.1 Uncharacterised protein [Yersinia mollaretii]CNL05484.1 Uncharacterised protein [Yersinia enterocolitica]CQR00031.1 Uncharacterised protein [Yersinia mollaretii]
MKVGILSIAKPIGSFAADKNPKVAVFGNSIANQFSAISNRSGCIGRGAGRMIARDLKQFNAMSDGRIGLAIAQDLKPQQSQQKQVQFAAALTHVQFFPKSA